MKLYNKQGVEVVDINPSKEINRGGEGAIYVHPKHPDQVIKVYHTSGTLSETVMQELMALPDNFIKPLELFYDRYKKIKGLSMKYLDTHRLTLLSNIFNKATATKGGFNDAVKKIIYEGIVTSISQAHQRGVVIGDLNPYNIFVSNKGEVYFIDVDSFQTKSRKHSGTMLPDIRDWLFNNIDENSDYYATSILIFQLFTHVHPYKGIHKSVRVLEERVIKHLSLLSGDKDLIIPSFYEPFTEKKATDQFFEIFQRDKRYLPSLGAGQIITKISHTPIVQTTNFKEGDMSVRIISIGVEDFDCSANLFYVRKDIATYELYGCGVHGTYGKLSTHQVQGMFLGNTRMIYMQYGKLYNNTLVGPMEITNFHVPINSFMHSNGGKVVYFDESNDTYSILDIDEIFNTHSIQLYKDTIFTKSVSVQSGIVQTISAMKWILDITSGQLRTLRTTLNIADVFLCPSGKYGVLEMKNSKGIDYNLFVVEGMKVILGPQLNGMSFFAEKEDYLYVGALAGIDVYRKLDLVKVATIACKYVNEQSVLKSCKAGLLCLTDDTLYLLNKI